MSCLNEDITTDSVPDIPLGNNVPNSDENVKKNTNGSPEKPPKKSKKQEKKSSTPKSKPSMFKGPISPGPMNMICISNASNVHIGNSFSINIAQPQQTSAVKPQNMKKTKEVKETLKCTEKVTPDDMDIVAEHVGKEWKRLGEELGYTNGQIERFYEDHHDLGLKEVVYQMLLDWKQSKGAKAIVGILCERLWSSGQCDAAIELSKLRCPEKEKSP